MSDVSNEIAELIDRYVTGKLNGEEKAMFETNMAIDPELFEAVEKQKVIHSILVESGLKDIRQLMTDDFKREKQFQKTKWIGGSLVLVAITGIGLYMMSTFSSDKNAAIVVEVKDSVAKFNATNSVNTSTATQNGMFSTIKENTPTVTTNQRIMTSNELKTNDVILPKEKEQIEENLSNTNAKVASNVNVSQTPTVVVDLCAGFKPNYSVRTSPSVVNKETGKLTVTSSDKKLTYSLNNGKTSFSSTFDELASGVYALSIRNDEGCVYKDESIKIAQTYCFSLEKEKFSPDLDQEYKWPIVYDDVVSIKIYNKQMQEVRLYNTTSFSWDGRNKDGQLVETGLYKIEVLYENGERCLFNLTVFN